MATELKDLGGLPMFVQEIKEGRLISTEEKLTLRKVCTEALMLNYPNEQVSGEEKYKRYQLANRVNITEGDEADLKAEDVAKLKQLIGMAYGPVVVGRAYDALDGGAA